MNYESKIKVLLGNGEYTSLEKWQEMYNISGSKIGKYFSWKEPRFRQDIEDYGVLVVCAPLIMVCDEYRERKGSPVNINSFNRSDEKQERLYSKGFKAAKISPHVVKMAADLDTYTIKGTREGVKILEDVSNDLGIRIRIGSELYIKKGSTFIHVDVCTMYYAPGMPFYSNEHPWQWEREARW